MKDNRVYIAKCDEYKHAADAARRVFDAFGGAAAVLGGRKRVLVKPNLLMPSNPDKAVTTHPAVIEAVCAAFTALGADVSIIDSSGAPHSKMILRMLYGKTGMKDAAKNSRASLCFDTTTKKEPITNGKAVSRLELLMPVLDAELVISVAKAKTHGFQAMTGSVKNMFGCVAGMGKPNLHRKFQKREDFAAMLVDVCEHINPGFCILDGVWGMEGAGPSGGDPKHLKVLAGGFSPYALDLAQCCLMGLRTDSVYTIMEAFARDLAPLDPRELTWLGDDYNELRTNFKPAVSRKEDAAPMITSQCAGCGDCRRICPMKCITIENNTAAIDEKKCIRCYCCHEFCPVKAIRL